VRIICQDERMSNKSRNVYYIRHITGTIYTYNYVSQF
jgi:hypothetical protein